MNQHTTATAIVLSRDAHCPVSRLRPFWNMARRVDTVRHRTLGEVRIRFSGEVIEWRGPAPYLFLPLPEDESTELRERPELSYGWGCIAVRATIGETTFETSLMPRDGRYLLPVKVVVQRAEGVDLGDRITATVTVLERG